MHTCARQARIAEHCNESDFLLKYTKKSYGKDLAELSDKIKDQFKNGRPKPSSEISKKGTDSKLKKWKENPELKQQMIEKVRSANTKYKIYQYDKETYELIKNNEVDVLLAATTKEELLFLDEFENLDVNLHPCTDDGSYGFEGYASNCLLSLLEDSTYDYAFVCGPEIMMKGIYDILEASSIPAQYSLERYMKCALGVCGQCCVDSEGWRICVEGPVFENDKINQITEFAKYRRDASGVKY